MQRKILRVLLTGVLTMSFLPLFGCAKTYRIDYQKYLRGFIDPPEKAKAGTTVTLKKGAVTDTIEEVLLDGEPLLCEGEEDGFLIYRFKMPAHDVTITIESHNISVVEKTLLIDYYSRDVAIVEEPDGESGYYELVLYDDGNADLLLEVYTDGGTPSQTVSTCRVPAAAADEARKLIEQYNMTAWNDAAEGESLDGAIYVCRFNLDGTFYRVTSEWMPSDGMDAFDAIRTLLQGYLS